MKRKAKRAQKRSSMDFSCHNPNKNKNKNKNRANRTKTEKKKKVYLVCVFGIRYHITETHADDFIEQFAGVYAYGVV